MTSNLYVGALMAPAVATYEPRDPSNTVFYQVIAEHLETLLASLDDDPDAKGLPAYVQREFSNSKFKFFGFKVVKIKLSG